jgi:hypothetical protein
MATAATAQQSVGFNGSFSGQKTTNRPIDTSRLSTPLPQVPTVKRPFTLESLMPSWMFPWRGSRNLIPNPKLTAGSLQPVPPGSQK